MIIGQRISTKMFFYHKEDNEFSQEASSLGNLDMFGLLFDDAMDTGFVLVSERTNAEVPFGLSKIEKDGEGDVAAWIFKAVSRKPNEQGLVVTIFND